MKEIKYFTMGKDRLKFRVDKKITYEHMHGSQWQYSGYTLDGSQAASLLHYMNNETDIFFNHLYKDIRFFTTHWDGRCLRIGCKRLNLYRRFMLRRRLKWFLKHG